MADEEEEHKGDEDIESGVKGGDARGDNQGVVVRPRNYHFHDV